MHQPDDSLTFGVDVVSDNPESVFEQLVDRYGRRVASFFARHGFPQEECRELTQETFIRVFKGMDRFRGDSSVETWLFQIAANIWRNEIRARRAEKREGHEVSLDQETDDSCLAPAHNVPSKGEGALDSMLEAERRRLTREALEKLPLPMRQCLELQVDQQLKYREIAEVLQISIETVKSQLFQARERLREELHDR